jgi:hypothetical protein
MHFEIARVSRLIRELPGEIAQELKYPLHSAVSLLIASSSPSQPHKIRSRATTATEWLCVRSLAVAARNSCRGSVLISHPASMYSARKATHSPAVPIARK